MTRYEVVSSFLANLYDDPDLIRCSDDKMIFLAKYVQKVTEHLDPPPFRYAIGTLIGDLRYCQFEFERDDPQKFTLFYIMDDRDPNDEYLHVRTFTEKTDFSTWNPAKEGSFFADLPKKEINFSILNTDENSTFWANTIALFGKNDMVSIQQMSATTPARVNKTVLAAISTISLMTNYISDIIKKQIDSFSKNNPRYVLMTNTNTVLITDDKGPVEPLGIDLNEPIYPKLHQLNSSFWENISQSLITVGTVNKPFEITFDETRYLVMARHVKPRNREIHTHTMIVAFSLDQSFADTFYPITKILIGTVSSVMMSILIVLYFSHKNQSKVERKFKKTTPLSNNDAVNNMNINYSLINNNNNNNSNNSVNNMNSNCDVLTEDMGIVPRAISQIRQLQLLYPEDVILNKVLDLTTENLAEQRQKQYEITSFGKNCPFCSFMIPPKEEDITELNSYNHKNFHDHTNRNNHNNHSNCSHEHNKNKNSHDNDLFQVWRQLAYPSFKLPKYKSFPFDDFLLNPEIMLVKYMMTLICEGNLFISIFDPDCLVVFFIRITKCIKNPVHTAHVLFALHELLSGPFHNWLNNRMDKFMLYFAAFSMQFEMEATLPTEEDLMAEEEEMMEAFYLMKKNFEVFNDDYSITEQNIQMLFQVLFECLPITKYNNLFRYFSRNLKKVLFSSRYKNQFELLGEIRIRVQSPEFSVTDHHDDRILFLLMLLKVSDFCEYWTTEELMRTCIQYYDKFTFSTQELEDENLIATYHYEYASKIVAPWISLMTNFYPLEKYIDNIAKTIQFWQGQMD